MAAGVVVEAAAVVATAAVVGAVGSSRICTS